jgi:hypothetical protein
MSPVFITLHLDEGGEMLVNVEDITAAAPAYGDAKGARVTVRGLRTWGVKDAIDRIREAMRHSGAIFD